MSNSPSTLTLPSQPLFQLTPPTTISPPPPPISPSPASSPSCPSSGSPRPLPRPTMLADCCRPSVWEAIHVRLGLSRPLLLIPLGPLDLWRACKRTLDSQNWGPPASVSVSALPPRPLKSTNPPSSLSPISPSLPTPPPE
ncbi:hypothetical protein PtA15_6A864 [Puccinia triticina]|uniref:Uncharacterized protein n=1 Tax=Puccinia triticina TaxID=208348 RepID=A0ABY7CU39_9BASI|nr:uncharacterized protein PtA15_6A864 [Puccinia triticina]WAQ86232.1 hypothetical protein PtA15_6A864 [Puccinia triticina]